VGGRAAEELVFQQQTTGAQGDLLTATQIATDMVCKWGMSSKMGPQAFSIDSGGFIEGAGGRLPMGHDTARFIDQEVADLLTECYAEAIRILKREQCLLKNLAEILLEVETLDGEEFDIIVECSMKKEAAAMDEPSGTCSTCSARDHCAEAKGVADEIAA